MVTRNIDELMGTRIIKVAAKDALEATYRVAITYTIDHFWPPEPREGERIFEVSVSAVDITPDPR